MILVLTFGVFLGYATVDDYRPLPVDILYQSSAPEILAAAAPLQMMIWNIGYGGLSADMDFFYDGGKKVRPPESTVQNNINQIVETLTAQSGLDFILLQEVDVHSKRSYDNNEYNMIKEHFPDYTSSFGKNYDVFFVPMPVKDPLGHVLSGLQTLSLHEPASVERRSFPGNYSWPYRLFMLDRCFMVNRYKLDNDRFLLIINTHNSAYDDGTLRAAQMAFMEIFLRNEFDKGNYVIVGGDWNQCPPNYSPGPGQLPVDSENRMDIDPTFMPDWKWIHDTGIATNRSLKTPFTKGETPVLVIDFFLVSPNIQQVTVKGIDLGFKHSDHQPILLTINLI